MKQQSLPLVSIVIPCYNYGKYITEAIASVQNSTYPNIEIIVINDGSTDEYTLQVLASLPDEVKVIHQQNMGLPETRNNGFREAKGKYVLPLDADDLIAPSFLEIGVHLLERCPQYAFVYSEVQLFGNENHIWYTGEYNLYELLLHNIIPATALLRRAAWERVGGYDVQMRRGYEDWELWIRLGLNGFYGKKIKKTLFFYRKHGPSMLAESKQYRGELTKYIRNKHKSVYLNPFILVRMLAATFKTQIIKRLMVNRS